MVFFNYASMEMSAKIVYYGPGLCGKTTNLKWIFDQLPKQHRGEMVSLATETDRTLFFDLLPLQLGKVGDFTTRIQLYTVPGQVFYNSTRKLVLKGVDGIVFVADSQEPMLDANIESLENLQENLAEQKLNLRKLPWVIQYNKRDLPGIMPVSVLNRHLNFMDVPFHESVATTGQGVMETLIGIATLTLRHLRKKAGEEIPEDDQGIQMFEQELASIFGAVSAPEPIFAALRTPPEPEPKIDVSIEEEPLVEEKPLFEEIPEEEVIIDEDVEIFEEPEPVVKAPVSAGRRGKSANVESPRAPKVIPHVSVTMPKQEIPVVAAKQEIPVAAVRQEKPIAIPEQEIPVSIHPQEIPLGTLPSMQAEGIVIDKDVTHKIRIPIRVKKDEDISHINLNLKIEIECQLVSEAVKKHETTAEKLASKALEDFLLGKSQRKKT